MFLFDVFDEKEINAHNEFLIVVASVEMSSMCFDKFSPFLMRGLRDLVV